MLRLLPKIGRPYFDFLVYPVGQCWEPTGHLKKECFHRPEALLLPMAILSVFLQAFEQSSRHFNYYGGTEYTDDELRHLGRLLARQINAVSSCRTPKQFRAILPDWVRGEFDDVLGAWLPKWRRVRNELETYGRQILHLLEQAEREHKALLVLGI